jgi:hypothetical protein
MITISGAKLQIKSETQKSSEIKLQQIDSERSNRFAGQPRFAQRPLKICAKAFPQKSKGLSAKNTPLQEIRY